MDKIELKALGKINLGLDILGRRDNGYHDVRMVMQTVFLYDRVTLENFVSGTASGLRWRSIFRWRRVWRAEARMRLLSCMG